MTTTAYLLGRLLAALESSGVLPPRGVELAAGNPVLTVAPAITQLHAKDRGDDISDIMAALPPDSLTATPLTAVEESDYWLGYYHQRAAIARGELPTAGTPAPAEPDLDARYEFRINSDLKAWVKANGGDKLVRALIRAAYERQQAK